MNVRLTNITILLHPSTSFFMLVGLTFMIFWVSKVITVGVFWTCNGLNPTLHFVSETICRFYIFHLVACSYMHLFPILSIYGGVHLFFHLWYFFRCLVRNGVYSWCLLIYCKVVWFLLFVQLSLTEPNSFLLPTLLFLTYFLWALFLTSMGHQHEHDCQIAVEPSKPIQIEVST